MIRAFLTRRHRRWLDQADRLLAERRFFEAAEHYYRAYDAKDQMLHYRASFGYLETCLMIADLDNAQRLLPHVKELVEFYTEHGAYDVDDQRQAQAAVHYYSALLFRHLRDFPAALVEIEEAARLQPVLEHRWFRAVMLKHVQRLDEAIEVVRTLVAERREDYVLQALVGYLYLAGSDSEARAIHAQVSATERAANPSNEAWIAACRGDRESCVEWVAKSFESDCPYYLLGFYGMEVEFDRFRDDQDFQQALARGAG